MRKVLTFLLTVVLLGAGSTTVFAKVQVGEAVVEKVETTHPYIGSDKGEAVFERVFHYPDAGYIAIHFSKFDLAPGDYIEISGVDGKYAYTYEGKGKVVDDGKVTLSEFWATHIPGDTAILKLYSSNPGGGWGFEIDQWARGYKKEEIEALLSLEVSEEEGLFQKGMSQKPREGLAGTKAVIGEDDKEWAKCYEGTYMYEKSRAVSRLLIGGTGGCSGFLIGSEGHLMTNNHCISTQERAWNTDYEFMAESPDCETPCYSPAACPGDVAATHGTLEATDWALDYSLIRLPANLSLIYGYFQFRNELPTVGERIYIPQHPHRYGKQLAVWSDSDDSGYAEVHSTNEPPCHGGSGDIGYYADTDYGSSGSAVVAYANHQVVALHHCRQSPAGSPNRGVRVTEIIADLGSLLPADAVAPPVPEAPSDLTALPACDVVSLNWVDNSDIELGFSIERRSVAPIGEFNFREIGTVGADITHFNDTNVISGFTYEYRVKAYNISGYSDPSNVISVTAIGTPTAPRNLTAQAVSCGQVDLSWRALFCDEDSFRIERRVITDIYITRWVEIASVGEDVTTYSDLTVKEDTTYEYRVRAQNICGYSDYSNIARVTTPHCPPEAPTELKAEVKEDTVYLIWKDNSDDEEGFNVYRGKPDPMSVTPELKFELIGVTKPDETFFKDTHVEPGKYYYKVCAFNRYGESCSKVIEVEVR